MGQQQSSSAEKSSGSRSTTPQAEKNVKRRQSLQALSHRSHPVEAFASNANAVAQSTTTHSVEKHSLQQILQSSSPELSSKNSRPERSSSRASKEHKTVEAIPTGPQPISTPLASETAPSVSIDIPTASTTSRGRPEETGEDFRAYQERHYAPISHLRPPRLPLPIADSRAPDSPTLQPINVSNADVPLFDTDEPISAIEPIIRRKSSFQSEATQEEEDMGDELQPFATEPTAHTVLTEIEWNQPGDRVFVTGTFATWDRKYRLHRRKNGDGMYTAVALPPGTHHLKFWVDGQMVTSDDLPTAVDFNNVLVNYIEISPEDLPKQQRRESTTNTAARAIQYPNAYPSAVPEETEQHPLSEAVTPGDEIESLDELQAEEIPPGDFRAIIPQYLQDIDYDQHDSRYQQAVAIISDSNAPPSLPMFLNRSILNGSTPVKDDSSVLTLPNHTVLNHLMTSSVKNGVLATSVTTRYKKKEYEAWAWLGSATVLVGLWLPGIRVRRYIVREVGTYDL